MLSQVNKRTQRNNTLSTRVKSAPKFKEEKYPVKLKDVTCHQAGDAYNITVDWKSSLISPGDLCFSVYKEDKEENFNLYQVPIFLQIVNLLLPAEIREKQAEKMCEFR